jgi:hypothetical protein
VSWLEEARIDRAKALRVDPFDLAHTTGRGGGYAQAALTAECERVTGAVNGTRNHTLNRAAFSLGQLIAGGELDEGTVIRELSAAARVVGLDEPEISNTIASGFRGGSTSPRSIPAQTTTDRGPVGRHHTDDAAEDSAQEQQVSPIDRWAEHLHSALVDSPGLDDIPDPEPLIGNDIVFRNSLVWVVGKPGCMKSFTALDMAGCVGTGEMWQGYRVAQGTVLYLVAEGVHGVKKRVRAWEKAMGRRMDNVYFLPQAVQSSNATAWAGLIEVVKRINPTMIVIDTQARVTVGVEENSNSEMGMFVDQAEHLRLASEATVFIVHHIGRNGDTGRGATTLDGAMSTIIRVTKEEDQVKLECQKNKDGAEWDDIELRAVPMEDSVVLMVTDGFRRRGSADEPSSAAMKTARTWWDSHGDKWASASGLIDVVAPKTTFYRHREELERAGWIVANTDARYPTYRLTRSPYPPEKDTTY